VKPLSLGESIPYFLIPSAVFLGSVHGLMPALDRAGVDLFAIFLIGLGGPLALLLVSTFVALRLEGTPRDQWRARLRLGPMGKGGWLWTIGLCVGFFLSPLLLGFTGPWRLDHWPMPDVVARQFADTPGRFMGHELLGAWPLWFGFFLFSLLNVIGEELWWRGYLLPRQELASGRWTWAAHGLLWAAFHSFFHWEVLGLLPGCLLLAYVSQRTRSTWPALFAHALIQVPVLIALFVGVLRG
jgi:membrane protease YdiL (CAAX protease family)